MVDRDLGPGAKAEDEVVVPATPVVPVVPAVPVTEKDSEDAK